MVLAVCVATSIGTVEGVAASVVDDDTVAAREKVQLRQPALHTARELMDQDEGKSLPVLLVTGKSLTPLTWAMGKETSFNCLPGPVGCAKAAVARMLSISACPRGVCSVRGVGFPKSAKL